MNVPPCTSSGGLPGAGAGGQVHDGALESSTLVVGAANDRDDQAALERNRDADIDLVVVNDVAPIDGSIDDGKGAQGLHCGARDERQEGERR
jgi:hypothetical protein